MSERSEVTDRRSKPHCVLVGPPGAGKSTVGGLVAEALGVRFFDTDTEVEKLVGKSIPDIFVEDGEAEFRKWERAAADIVLTFATGVVSLGGGAILAPETRAKLAGHTVIYLSVELADAVRRVGLGAGRPLLTVNPRATLKYLMDQRRPLYLEVATATIATDGRTPEEVTAAVLAVLG